MALGADVNADLAALGRTGNEALAASTLNGYFFVVRMESFLHDNELYALNENDSRDFARLTFFGGRTPSFRRDWFLNPKYYITDLNKFQEVLQKNFRVNRFFTINRYFQKAPR